MGILLASGNLCINLAIMSFRPRIIINHHGRIDCFENPLKHLKKSFNLAYINISTIELQENIK